MEKTWNSPTKNSSIDYVDLSSGIYTLKVKAKTAHQQWSEPFIYQFTIQPAWWQTNWAYMGFASLLGCIIWVSVNFWLLMKTEKLEMLQLKEKFGQLTTSNNSLQLLEAKKEDKFLEMVRFTLESHLSDENFGIAELCEILTISRTQLHRKLKELTGLSTSHYIRHLRLSIAKKMLEETNLNISEVAFKVGFSSVAYFSQSFKKEFGFTPSNIK